jgi:hypothetical protein
MDGKQTSKGEVDRESGVFLQLGSLDLKEQ